MGRITVVGLGLIGGSTAVALKRAGHYVAGYDTDPESADTAKSLDLINDSSASLGGALAGSDVVVVAVPIAAVSPVLSEVAQIADADATVLDMASVKGFVAADMETLPYPHRFVGGHPMAGTEGTGPASARADLFYQRPFALVPTPYTSQKALRAARSLVETVGAYPLVIEAVRHDQVVARTSHMPYIASTALALSCEAGDERLAGPGLHDMLRLASSDYHMWHEIAVRNREPMLMALSRYREKLEEIIRALDDRRWDDLDVLLHSGRNAAVQLRGTSS